MVPSINSFGMTDLKGRLDLMINSNTLAARVKSDEAVALVVAQAVKQVDVAGGVPVVTAVTADTDDVFGFVNYNAKDASFVAGQPLEVSGFQGNVMVMEASAAFAAGAALMVVVSGSTVALATSGKRVIGKAIDKATAAGDLVRVYINLPGALA